MSTKHILHLVENFTDGRTFGPGPLVRKVALDASNNYRVVIGRSSSSDKTKEPRSNNTLYNVRCLSRMHGAFFVDPETGSLYYEDLGSRHGSEVLLPFSQQCRANEAVKLSTDNSRLILCKGSTNRLDIQVYAKESIDGDEEEEEEEEEEIDDEAFVVKESDKTHIYTEVPDSQANGARSPTAAIVDSVQGEESEEESEDGYSILEFTSVVTEMRDIDADTSKEEESKKQEQDEDEGIESEPEEASSKLPYGDVLKLTPFAEDDKYLGKDEDEAEKVEEENEDEEDSEDQEEEEEEEEEDSEGQEGEDQEEEVPQLTKDDVIPHDSDSDDTSNNESVFSIDQDATGSLNASPRADFCPCPVDFEDFGSSNKRKREDSVLEISNKKVVVELATNSTNGNGVELVREAIPATPAATRYSSRWGPILRDLAIVFTTSVGTILCLALTAPLE